MCIRDSLQGGIDRPDYILIFCKAGVRGAVRVNQAIHTEVSVVRIFAEIAAIAVLLFPLRRRAGIHGMVAKLPDKAARRCV